MPFVLQARDRAVMEAVSDYGTLSTEEVFALFAKESRNGLYRRLHGLFQSGYLDRLRRGDAAKPIVHSVGRRGAAELGVAYRRREVEDGQVLHGEMITRVRMCLALACKEAGISMAWRGWEIEAPIRPDGFVTLVFPDREEGRSRAHFLIECDRSTMPVGRYGDKLRRYEEWAAGGGQQTLGI